MARLYLEKVEDLDPKSKNTTLTLESLIVLFIYEYLERPKGIEVILIDNSKQRHQLEFNITIPKGLKLESFPFSSAPKDSKITVLPAIVTDESNIISGLCAVCRALVKLSPNFESLLGFKNGCLMAPSEASVWTKFCEVDIIECIKEVYHFPLDSKHQTLSIAMSRFEKHMEQPVRIHNIKRIEMDLAKIKLNQDPNSELIKTEPLEEIASKPVKEKVPRINKKHKKKPNELKTEKIEHIFVEGHLLTLADLIIFASYYLILRRISKESLLNLIPLTVKWFQNVQNNGVDIMGTFFQNLEMQKIPQDTVLTLQESPNVSLYKSDPKRYKPRKKIYTKQEDIEKVLEKLSLIPVEFVNKNESSPGRMVNIDWNNCPGLPEVGDLPQERIERKRDQLKSLAQEVMGLAKEGDTIVDFCCGSGHLGILIAALLPQCHIILLENKEESLGRAKLKCNSLNLSNVTFLQSNLDYFTGDFQIGASLHACGVVTDIVMEKCITAKAHFVSCPCCYGAIHDMHHLTYPRSKLFKGKDVSGSDYFTIAHCSDQAHDAEKGPCNKEKSEQGQFCMDIVDTDRKFYAIERDYDVILTKLEPENCSQKNRLLIGKYKGM